MNLKKLFMIAATAMCPFLAGAENLPAIHSLQVRYEQFTWREFGLDGKQILKESGPRVGLLWERETRHEDAPDWSVRALAYFGDVDYDGQTQLGEPIESTTEYHGIQTDAALRLPVATGEHTEVIPFAGAGVHTWLRRLDNTRGFAETGYDEWWVDLYAQAGLDFRWQQTRGEFFARAGIRYPFYTRAEYDFVLPDGTGDASVEPGADISFFGACGYRANDYTVSLFAEDTAYDRSETKTYGQVDVFQPESEQQIFGLQLGVVF